MMLRTIRLGLCGLAVALGAVSVDAAPAVADRGSFAAERGSFSPSAPVRLDYELPDVLPTSGPFDIPLSLSTPVTTGQLVFEVARSEGVSVVDGASRRFDLAGATQPFTHVLKVALIAGVERYVIVVLSVDGPVGMQSRSYRIDLSDAIKSEADDDQVLKLMPAAPR